MKAKQIRTIGFSLKTAAMTAKDFRLKYESALTPEEIEHYIKKLGLADPEIPEPEIKQKYQRGKPVSDKNHDEGLE